MDWKSFLGLSGKKKNTGELDSLFGDIEEIENHEKKSNSKEKSSYEEEEDIFEAPKDQGFYGVKDVDDERKDEERRRTTNRNVFNFSWWEYAIIFIEFILLVYVILLFLGVFTI